MSIVDDPAENNKINFEEIPAPAGQDGFDSRAQHDRFLGGGGLDGTSQKDRLGTETETKVDSFLAFAKEVDAHRPKQALGEKIGSVIDTRYFQQEQPPKQSRIAKIFRRPLSPVIDWPAHRRRDLVEALSRSPSHAKITLLKEVMPRFRSLGGGGLVEDFTKIIDYDFDTGTSMPDAQTSSELTESQSHEQVESFLKFIRENDAQKVAVSGRNFTPDVSVAVDKVLKDNPSLRRDLDHRLQRQGLSAMKAEILMKVMHNFPTHIKGGIDSDLAKVIDYTPSTHESSQ